MQVGGGVRAHRAVEEEGLTRKTVMKATWIKLMAGMGVLAAGVVMMLGMTCTTWGADEAVPTMAPGTYALTVNIDPAPGADDENNDALGDMALAELKVKGETITLTVKPDEDDEEEYVFTGTMAKGIIKFSVTMKEDEKAFTATFEGKVKSDTEAGGTFTVTSDDEKVTGKWTLAPQEEMDLKPGEEE